MNKKNIILLTLTSFFADISTEMMYPILPIFLTQILGAPATIVGLIEGIAIGTQNIVQGFAGYVSDKIRRRKPVALFGYALAAIAKPVIGAAGFWPQVLIGRFADRFGSGTRSAPRDGLVAASADEGSRGRAFGLEGVGDQLGAVVGPLIAIFLLYSLHVNLRNIFYLAFIPGLIAVLLVLLVKEKAPTENHTPAPRLTHFPKGYWQYLAGTAIFGIANFSNAFLILQARALGIPLEATILIYVFFNAVAAITSYPAGRIADLSSRKSVLLAALGIFILTFLGFGLLKNPIFIGTLFVLYGAYSGIYRTIGKTIASDFVPQEARASAVGWYATTIGITSFASSLLAGEIWVRINPAAAFLYGATIATAAFAYFGLANLPSKGQ